MVTLVSDSVNRKKLLAFNQSTTKHFRSGGDRRCDAVEQNTTILILARVVKDPTKPPATKCFPTQRNHLHMYNIDVHYPGLRISSLSISTWPTWADSLPHPNETNTGLNILHMPVSINALWALVVIDIHLLADAPGSAASMIRVVAGEMTMLEHAKLLVTAAVVEFLELTHVDDIWWDYGLSPSECEVGFVIMFVSPTVATAWEWYCFGEVEYEQLDYKSLMKENLDDIVVGGRSMM